MKRKVELGLVKSEERSLPNLADVRELVEGLDRQEQELVLSETTEFYRARQAGMLSYLEMGKHLQAVRAVLEPHELWKKYANGLPNMGIATAYRYINAWENAQKALPLGTLRVVARDGYRLIETSKNGGLKPAFAEAVKAVTKEIGPAPDKETEAVNWLQAVVTKKRQMAKTKPVDAHKRFSMARLVRRVVGVVKPILAKLPDDRRAAFVQRVIDELMSLSTGKKAPMSVAA